MPISMELCVEIEASLKGGGKLYGSGYQISEVYILTAAHVIFGEENGEVDFRSPIKITWRCGEKKGKAKSFKKDIIWFCKEESVDLAVLSFSQKKSPGYSPKLSEFLSTDMFPANKQWDAAGFAAALADMKGDRALGYPAGDTSNTNHGGCRLPYVSLTSTKGTQMSRPELWGGYSGGPVYINDRLFGVLLATEAGQENGFTVSLIGSHLDNLGEQPQKKALREVLGLPEHNVELQEFVKSNLIEIFEKNPDVLQTADTRGSAEEFADELMGMGEIDFIDKLCEIFDQKGFREKDSNLSLLEEILCFWLIHWVRDVCDVLPGGGKNNADYVACNVSNLNADVVEVEPAMGRCFKGEHVPSFLLRDGKVVSPFNLTQEALFGMDEEQSLEKESVERDLLLSSMSAIEDLAIGFWKSKRGELIDKYASSRGGKGKLVSRLIKRLGERRKGFFYQCVDQVELVDEVFDWCKDLKVVVVYKKMNEKRNLLIVDIQELLKDISQQRSLNF